ncbi:MAG: SHD1 domain-containing protein [Pirellulales bacterium]
MPNTPPISLYLIIAIAIFPALGCGEETFPNNADSSSSVAQQSNYQAGKTEIDSQKAPAGETFGSDSIIKSTELPTYTIEDSYVGGFSNKVLVLTARLSRKLSENDLRRLALRINSEHDNLGRIFFMLPGMTRDWGVWARCDFDDELEITIFGLSITDDEAIDRADATISGEILGQWSSETVGNACRYSLYRNLDKTFIKTTFKDGSGITSEVVEKPSSSAKRFEEVKGLPGEYFLVDASGALERGDKEGIWLTLPPVNRELKRQSSASSPTPPQLDDPARRIGTNSRKPREELVVSLTVEPKVRDDMRVVITGKTNLPADAQLMVTVEDAVSPVSAYQTKTSVLTDGSFQSEPLGQLTGLEAGWYVASVTVPYAMVQPKHVREAIGSKGDVLTGPLVKKDGTFGTTIKVEQKFLVGENYAPANQVARLKKELDEHKLILQRIKDVFSRLERMKDDGAFDDTKHSVFQIGSTFREFISDHRAISDRVDKIGRTGAGIGLGLPLADLMTMLLSAKDEKENEYRDARSQYREGVKNVEEYLREREPQLSPSSHDSTAAEGTPDVSAFNPIENIGPAIAEDKSFRVWTSANGKFTVVAKLVKISSRLITLENSAGKQIEVQIVKLSKDDQGFIENWRSKVQR